MFAERNKRLEEIDTAGNLTSQFFANIYLNAFDHYITEELCPGGYIRFVDEFLIKSINEIGRMTGGWLKNRTNVS